MHCFNTGDIDLFEEEDSSDCEADVDHNANGVVFSEKPPTDRRWLRNTLTQVPCNVAHAQ